MIKLIDPTMNHPPLNVLGREGDGWNTDLGEIFHGLRSHAVVSGASVVGKAAYNYGQSVHWILGDVYKESIARVEEISVAVSDCCVARCMRRG